jgi:hypothetical protein
MLHSVKKVDYVEGYKLKLRFEDKSVRIVDLASMLKQARNMFVPLKNIEYFKQVTCDGITISWPNGVDLCPDVLYKMGKPLSPQKTTHSRSRRKSKSKI